MAMSESIRDAMQDVSDQLLTAKLMCETFTILSEGKGPHKVAGSNQYSEHGWVFVMARTMDRLDKSFEELECLVNVNAIPVMRDLEAANKGQLGGVRAVAAR